MSYKCPITQERGYDIIQCESHCFGEGCKHIGKCEVYKINKNDPNT